MLSYCNSMLQEVWQHVKSAKLRAFLALLGIFIGTAAVVAMVSCGQIATYESLKQYKNLGTDLLALSLTDAEINGIGAPQALSLQSIKQLSNLDSAILRVAPYTQVYSPLSMQGIALHGSVLGVTQSFAELIHIELQQGRFISFLDEQPFFCVIGQGLYEQIKKITLQNPLGQTLTIGKNIFTIIGVAKPWAENSFVYANIDSAVMIPVKTSFWLNKYATINNIILRLTASADIATVEERITQYLQQVLPNKHLYFRSAKELIKKMANQKQIFTIFLGLIGGISLLVGGMGIMNIMLVSVIERRWEIGIRLAVGATPRDIQLLFLMEATLLSLLGGVAGVLLGMGIAYCTALIWHWEFIFFMTPPLIGFLVSALIGIFFGFYPAYSASRSDPIVALRTG